MLMVAKKFSTLLAISPNRISSRSRPIPFMPWINDPAWEAEMRALGFDIDGPPQPASHSTSRRKVKDGHGRYGRHATTGIAVAHGQGRHDAVAAAHGQGRGRPGLWHAAFAAAPGASNCGLKQGVPRPTPTPSSAAAARAGPGSARPAAAVCVAMVKRYRF